MSKVVSSKDRPLTTGETLIDVRVGTDNQVQNQIILAKDYSDDDDDINPDYIIFVNWENIGSFKAKNDKDAVSEGLIKIRELLEHLRLDKVGKVLNLAKKEGVNGSDNHRS